MFFLGTIGVISRTSGVDFINILRASFCKQIWCQKLQSCCLGLKFFGTKILAKKHAQNVDEIDYRSQPYSVTILSFYVVKLENCNKWKIILSV